MPLNDLHQVPFFVHSHQISHQLAILENLEGRDAHNAVLTRQIDILVHVDLGNDRPIANLALQLIENGTLNTAGATPRRES